MRIRDLSSLVHWLRSDCAEAALLLLWLDDVTTDYAKSTHLNRA